MPSFDLRYIQIAEYNNNSGTVSYTNKTSIGDAMSVDIQMRYAEGRVYAESTLAEYMRKATGGSISIAEKYIPDAAQKIMYGSKEKTRTLSGSKTVKSLVSGSANVAKYVGTSFYAPDMVDGVEKYTCCFVYRALFGAPNLTYRTMGDNIQFNTPTTTGEFLADHSADKNLVEVAVIDSEEDAKAWCDLVLGGASA